MFKCPGCGVSCCHGRVIVLKIREYVFPARYAVHRHRIHVEKKCKARCSKVGGYHYHDDPGGFGTQIVEEKRFCLDCISNPTPEIAKAPAYITLD